MKRPSTHSKEYLLDLTRSKYCEDLENYCDLLEQTISALRDDYSEQVRVTADLRRRLKEEGES